MSAVPLLDPTATISQAFDIYKRYAGVLLPLAFGLFAIQAVVALAAGDSSVAALIALLVSTILSIFFQGAVVELVRDVQDGTLDSSVGQLLGAIAPIVGVLFVVGIINAIAVGVGFILLIVPGLFLMTIFAVVGPVTVIERPGIFAAFSRSRDLVRGSGWQVFGLILFTLVLSIAGGIVAGIISVGGDAAGVIAQWIVNALLAPISALIFAVTYLKLREAHGDKPVQAGAATPDGPQY